MKSRFYKIKFTAASDQVLNCQPKIVILNNICHSVTTTDEYGHDGSTGATCVRKKINNKNTI
jgi:hypothetical protein